MAVELSAKQTTRIKKGKKTQKSAEQTKSQKNGVWIRKYNEIYIISIVFGDQTDTQRHAKELLPSSHVLEDFPVAGNGAGDWYIHWTYFRFWFPAQRQSIKCNDVDLHRDIYNIFVFFSY